jgi:serine/threonine protein kinase
MTADARDDATPNALPVGTRFGELEILGTLGVGGFGIVYLARDHALERDVAVKEYMPSQFASRDGRSHVSVRAASMRETFELGLSSFVNEAKLLARFDHPSLLKVYRFWEANGTAYMAMPRLSGQSLREARTTQTTPPPAAWLRRIFDAVLSGLETLHAQQVWHRDVAPDNILLPADGGPPILLDFGAARQAIGDRTQLFTAILKPSFAPIEQYAEATTLRQGPWTDFYALAAVMYELLTGRPPPPATARAMTDECEPLAAQALAGYESAFLAGLDWALRVPPHQRPQTAAAWREVLDGRAPVPAPQAAAPRPAPVPPPPPPAPMQLLDLEFADTVQAVPSQFELPEALAAQMRAPEPPPKAEAQRVLKPRKPKPPASPTAKPAAPTPWRYGSGPLILGGGVAALVLLGVFALQLRPRPARLEVAQPAPEASAPAASAAMSDAAASAPEVAAASAPVVPVASAVPASGAVPTASPPPRPAVARREPKPILTEKAGEFRPVASAVVEAPAPVAASAAPKPAPEPAPPAEPKTASEACGGRVLFARAWCIDRQCEKPIYRDDPDCVRLRDIRSSRNNNNP